MSDKVPKTFIVDCPKCRAKVAAIEHGCIRWSGGVDMEGEPHYGISVHLGKCPKCHTILVGESQQIGIENYDSYVDEWADAITYFEKYVELVPDDPKGWNNLGVALREKGEVKRAIECYNKALVLDPTLEIVRTNMGTAKDMQLIL